MGLKVVVQEYQMIKGNFAEVNMSAEERAKKNAQLKKRLESMQKEIGGQMNELFSKMMGVDPRDLMTDEEIDKDLAEAFHKFDEDNSGQLGAWEFQQAWFFLGLKGDENEIKDAYAKVNTNAGDQIDIEEFMTAIKGERMVELNLKNVLTKMGVELQSKESMYEAFKATERRRRMMKREWDTRVSELTKDIISKLAGISNLEIPAKDPKDEKLYQTLTDTFNAFDKDGSGEMGYPEYVEAWKFLGRAGGEDEIRKTSDSVDIDGSGNVAIEEFVMSLMGKKAMQFGALADLETLVKLLDETSGLLAGLQADLGDAQMSVEQRAARNAELRERLT